MNTLYFRFSLRFLAGAILCLGLTPAFSQEYEFTATFGPVGSARTGYFDYNNDGTATLIGGSGTAGIAAIQIDVSAIDGNPASENHMAFCVELEQSISQGVTYVYDFVANPAEIRLFDGGLSVSQVGQLKYLFDNYYQGPVLADWGTTGSIRNEYIFQLAVWEITHDTDLTLTATTGSLYFTGTDATVAAAESLLGSMASLGAGYFDTYETTTWEIAGLSHATSQDLVYAQMIPEPSSAILVLAGGIFFLLLRRPRQFPVSGTGN